MSRRSAVVGRFSVFGVLILLHLVAYLHAYPYGDPVDAFNSQSCTQECSSQVSDFLSYHECCGDDCCHRYRFWVIPGMIAAVGFFGGAFFALCFQCR
ncbi:unnamed protein product, partial [Mesorhabditis spiculigera]